MPRPPSREEQRAALRKYEAAYARWSTASEALAQAELRLWTVTVEGAGAASTEALAAEVLRLREEVRVAAETLRSVADGAP